MRILVVTSCTGEKVADPEGKLGLEDFQAGPEHVAAREAELSGWMTPAEELYSGMQHVRLMRGVRAFREGFPPGEGEPQLDLRILSAGYGLVPGDRKLAPYEATFAGMKKGELRRWAEELQVAQGIRQVLRAPYDLGLVLLGENYLEACALDDGVELGGPTLLLCSGAAAKKLPELDRLRVVELQVGDTKRFSCGLVGLKGEVGARLLERIVLDPEMVRRVVARGFDVLAELHKPILVPKSAAEK